jgi:hypothetical protein
LALRGWGVVDELSLAAWAASALFTAGDVVVSSPDPTDFVTGSGAETRGFDEELGGMEIGFDALAFLCFKACNFARYA